MAFKDEARNAAEKGVDAAKQGADTAKKAAEEAKNETASIADEVIIKTDQMFLENMYGQTSSIYEHVVESKGCTILGISYINLVAYNENYQHRYALD